MNLIYNRNIRVGFIGAGNWAEFNHMPILKEREDVELVGIATPTKKSRGRVTTNFNIQYSTSDYRELLNKPLDAVIISSPHGYHFEHAKASLEAHLHVMVEKPMTLRASESWELVKLAKQKGLVLMNPTGYHYNPIVIAAKEQMDKGAVGSIEYMFCHIGSALRNLYMGEAWPYSIRRIPDPKKHYSDPQISGGGQGYSQLSHSVAMLLWLTGLRATNVFAYMTGPGAQVEFYDAIVARLDNGAIATISGAGTQPSNKTKHELDLRIYGTEGELSFDLFYEHFTVHREDGRNLILNVKAGDGEYTCDGPIHNFIDLIRGKSSNNFSPAEIGARSIELIEAAYRSAALGKEIEV
ncbi:MAG: hypothetical protein CL661_09340 [Bacteroidetes bacterium]|nr:hypothetical protein [Bacteroidota bacterium]|tara:strand:+ start:1049 stop:2107 length:1059 start_codon:yes stop_codon:yes gene_type:complete